MTDAVRERVLYAQILPVVAGAVRDVIEKLPLEEEDREGGYFCIAERENPFVPIAVVLIGQVMSHEKREKYFNYAREKAKRLGDIPLPSHVSSWLTRDPERNQWGGGIKTDRYYMAFSGLPELADEAAMLLAALRLGFLTKNEAEDIAKKSNNFIFLGHEWMVAHRV